jgi:hypothetical protein
MCKLHVQFFCLKEIITLGEGGKTCYSSLSIGEEKDKSIWFCNYYIFGFHKPIQETWWCLAKNLEGFGVLHLKGFKAFAHLWKHLALEISIHQSPCFQFSFQSSFVDKILPTMVKKINWPTWFVKSYIYNNSFYNFWSLDALCQNMTNMSTSMVGFVLCNYALHDCSHKTRIQCSISINQSYLMN